MNGSFFVLFALMALAACREQNPKNQGQGFQRPQWPGKSLDAVRQLPPFVATVLDRQIAGIPLSDDQRLLHDRRSAVTVFGVVLRPQTGSEFAIIGTDATPNDITLISSLQTGSSYTFSNVLTVNKQ